MGWDVAAILGGLVALVIGAELLVRGASGLAARLGVTPLVIGLTVVAYGTSAPELAVSVDSALRGQPDLAVGNVVGSNIFNVLVVLGLSALAAPLVVQRQVVRREVPLLLVVSLVVAAMAFDGRVSRVDGILLALGAVAYTVLQVRTGGAEGGDGGDDEGAAAPLGPVAGVALCAVGLGGLVLGADQLVHGATGVARVLGVSDLVIGLTIVAGGTSLPELATSVVAAARGQRDLAVGNVVGSNLFNLLAVLGGTAALSADGVDVAPAILRFDLPVMLAATVACLPVMASRKIGRGMGGFFAAYYVAYLVWIALDATEHDALEPYSTVMLLFVLPLTVTGLVLFAVRARRG